MQERERNPHERAFLFFVSDGTRTMAKRGTGDTGRSRSQHLPRRKRKRPASQSLLFTRDLAWVLRPECLPYTIPRVILNNTFITPPLAI